MKKKKKSSCYRKFDEFPEGVLCCFCNTSFNDSAKFGEIYKICDITMHYFCLLSASEIEQRGDDKEALLGFYTRDIKKEIARGLKNTCFYCNKRGATIICVAPSCGITFHLPCGLDHGSLHQYFNTFRSFCRKHKPQQVISSKLKKGKLECPMCVCTVKISKEPFIWPPCCKPSLLLHKICCQKMASNSGYALKCPLCNNKDDFVKGLKKYGIYIPDQEATWELEERTTRNRRDPDVVECMADKYDSTCQCPKGKLFSVKSSPKWYIEICVYCGCGMHLGCMPTPLAQGVTYKCQLCAKVDQGISEANSVPVGQPTTANLRLREEGEVEEVLLVSPRPGPANRSDEADLSMKTATAPSRNKRASAKARISPSVNSRSPRTEDHSQAVLTRSPASTSIGSSRSPPFSAESESTRDHSNTRATVSLSSPTTTTSPRAIPKTSGGAVPRIPIDRLLAKSSSSVRRRKPVPAAISLPLSRPVLPKNSDTTLTTVPPGDRVSSAISCRTTERRAAKSTNLSPSAEEVYVISDSDSESEGLKLVIGSPPERSMARPNEAFLCCPHADKCNRQGGQRPHGITIITIPLKNLKNINAQQPPARSEHTKDRNVNDITPTKTRQQTTESVQEPSEKSSGDLDLNIDNIWSIDPASWSLDDISKIRPPPPSSLRRNSTDVIYLSSDSEDENVQRSNLPNESIQTTGVELAASSKHNTESSLNSKKTKRSATSKINLDNDAIIENVSNNDCNENTSYLRNLLETSENICYVGNSSSNNDTRAAKRIKYTSREESLFPPKVILVSNELPLRNICQDSQKSFPHSQDVSAFASANSSLVVSSISNTASKFNLSESLLKRIDSPMKRNQMSNSLGLQIGNGVSSPSSSRDTMMTRKKCHSSSTYNLTSSQIFKDSNRKDRSSDGENLPHGPIASGIPFVEVSDSSQLLHTFNNETSILSNENFYSTSNFDSVSLKESEDSSEDQSKLNILSERKGVFTSNALKSIGTTESFPTAHVNKLDVPFLLSLLDHATESAENSGCNQKKQAKEDQDLQSALQPASSSKSKSNDDSSSPFNKFENILESSPDKSNLKCIKLPSEEISDNLQGFSESISAIENTPSVFVLSEEISDNLQGLSESISTIENTPSVSVLSEEISDNLQGFSGSISAIENTSSVSAFKAPVEKETSEVHIVIPLKDRASRQETAVNECDTSYPIDPVKVKTSPESVIDSTKENYCMEIKHFSLVKNKEGEFSSVPHSQMVKRGSRTSLGDRIPQELATPKVELGLDNTHSRPSSEEENPDDSLTGGISNVAKCSLSLPQSPLPCKKLLKSLDLNSMENLDKSVANNKDYRLFEYDTLKQISRSNENILQHKEIYPVSTDSEDSSTLQLCGTTFSSTSDSILSEHSRDTMTSIDHVTIPKDSELITSDKVHTDCCKGLKDSESLLSAASTPPCFVTVGKESSDESYKNCQVTELCLLSVNEIAQDQSPETLFKEGSELELAEGASENMRICGTQYNASDVFSNEIELTKYLNNCVTKFNDTSENTVMSTCSYAQQLSSTSFPVKGKQKESSTLAININEDESPLMRCDKLGFTSVLIDLSEESHSSVTHDLSKESDLDKLSKESDSTVLHNLSKESDLTVLDKLSEETYPAVIDEHFDESGSTVLDAFSNESNITVLDKLSKEADSTGLHNLSKESDLTVLDKLFEETYPAVIDEHFDESGSTVLDAFSNESNITVLDKLSKEADSTGLHNLSKESDLTVLDKLFEETYPAVIDEHFNESGSTVLDAFSNESNITVLDKLSKEADSTVLYNLSKESDLTVLDKLSEEMYPAVIDEHFNESGSTVLDAFSNGSNITVLDKLSKEADSTVLHNLSKESDLTVLDKLSEETYTAIIDEHFNESGSTVLDAFSNESNITVLDKLSKEADSTVLHNLSKESDLTVLDKLSKEADSTVLHNLSKESDLTVLDKLSKEADSTVLHDLSKESDLNVLDKLSKESDSTILDKLSEETDFNNKTINLKNQYPNVNEKYTPIPSTSSKKNSRKYNEESHSLIKKTKVSFKSEENKSGLNNSIDPPLWYLVCSDKNCPTCRNSCKFAKKNLIPREYEDFNCTSEMIIEKDNTDMFSSFSHDEDPVNNKSDTIIERYSTPIASPQLHQVVKSEESHKQSVMAEMSKNKGGIFPSVEISSLSHAVEPESYKTTTNKESSLAKIAIPQVHQVVQSGFLHKCCSTCLNSYRCAERNFRLRENEAFKCPPGEIIENELLNNAEMLSFINPEPPDEGLHTPELGKAFKN